MVVVAGLGLGLFAQAGCELDSDNATALCSAFCDCQTSLPSAHRTCVDQCVSTVPDAVPESCTQCILAASCAELVRDACDDVCSVDPPEEDL
jgi:hypothetical protein